MIRWENLHRDMLLSIIDRLKKIEDYFSFIGVCSAWRDVKGDYNIGKSFESLLWLMLPEKKEKYESKVHGIETAYLPSKSKIIPYRKDDCKREFLCLQKRKIYKMSLPETLGKKILSTKGWLITVSTNREINLFHPITRKSISLPPQTAFGVFYDSTYFPYQYISKVVLSSSPFKGEDFTLMVIHGVDFRLGFWKPGLKCWIVLKVETGFKDICYCDNEFYAVNDKGVIFRCDLVSRTAVVLGGIREHMCYPAQLYLAGKVTENAMLLVVRHGSCPFGRPREIVDCSSIFTYPDGEQVKLGAYKFNIYQIEIRDEPDTFPMFIELNDLGGKALFIGYNETALFESFEFDDETVRKNHIYFTEDHFERHVCYCPIQKECPHSGECENGIPHLGGTD